ncbi:hypothetical protein O6H91_13G057200 [Diphasiastrum complanatum]|uniref:Uncharacterized protein n=2 Tax=Diphasiastrum complanatum TaxID=34168 RepID=A0ACC2BVQ0_DIPCM|nr:hypothetical protein O6H91_13G057200 [Diphasiastrum complanatum]KAJ7533621.1 hypothetical protein O6H91_13G057200 [Diphasiastrum complanatum]
MVGHPVLMTECPCNPLHSRSKMAELLFETYDVPSLAFGVDGVFSYGHNRQLGVCESDGLVICSGHMTTHVIPIVGGEPIMEACSRSGVGGFHVTDYLKRLLTLQYPYHMNNFAWEKIEALKQEHCYIAENYSSELLIFQDGQPDAVEKTKFWQLPWVPPPEKEQPSEEQLARKAAIKEKQGQRLREMAAAKRSSKIADLEAELHSLEDLLQEIDTLDDVEAEPFLSETGYSSKQDVHGAHTKVAISLRKAKGENVEVEKDKIDPPPEEKYPLLEVPNEQLTEEQLKEKKKQRFLKMTSEGRARAKQKRHEEELQREKDQALEEERRLENPEQYLEELRSRQTDLASKIEQRKRQKTDKSNGVSSGAPAVSGLGGRGDRLTAIQKERMKLLTKAAFDRGKEEDTFGIKDEDWQLYKQMDKDHNEDEEFDEDEAELGRLNTRLQEIDPLFTPMSVMPEVIPETQQRPLTESDFRIPLEVERFRCPEVIFEPSMIGLDQAGIGEMVSISLRRLPQEYLQQVSNGTLLLTGGNCLLSGYDARLYSEVQKTRPFGAVIKIVKASDPLLDAWHGASTYAASNAFHKYSFTKADYEERGPGWLQKYKLKYAPG